MAPRKSILHCAADFADMANGSGTLMIQILRGSTVINEMYLSQGAVGQPPPVIIPVVDRSTASGDVTYTMRALFTGENFSAVATNRFIGVLNALK